MPYGKYTLGVISDSEIIIKDGKFCICQPNTNDHLTFIS